MKSGWLTVINWIILLQVFTFAVNASPAPRIVAKAYLGMPNFPSASAWQSLNETVKGRLIKFAHPGASCYVSTFNELECERFRDQLSNATAVGENPFLTNWPQWAGNPCQPTADNYTVDPQAPKCKQGKFPDYALAARSAEDVSIGLKFAAKWNIRVIVKNTGHDFLGRNVGTGALSIWTRNIQGFEWIDEWKQGIKTSAEKHTAVRYGSGMTWAKINFEVHNRNYTIVSGAEGTVGAGGGFLHGGGHGPMSNVYGLGVENVLEMEVVTPNGDIVIANTESHPDLFWALRGGGASTYGITTKITYKVYPMPPFAFYWVAFAPLDPDFDSYYHALSYYYSQSPQFTDFGISGYPVVSKWGYVAALIAPNKTNEEVDAFFAPIAERMQRQWNITLETIALYPDSLGDILWPREAPTDWAEPATQFYTMTSRLIARSAMTESNLPAIFKFVKTTLDDDSWHLPYPNMPGIAKRNREWNFALNPAWLDASMHLAILNNNFDSLKELWSYYDRVDQYLTVLDPLSVNSGAYINEASPFEKDWKRTFYGGGERYEKMLSIKKKYDPNNILWCFPCVGGDVFKEDKDGRLYQ